MKKKANIVMEGVMFIIIIFVFAMISILGFKVFSDLVPGIESDLTHNESNEALSEVEDRYPSVFSGLIIFVLVGFWAFVLIAAMMSTEHPIMFIFSLILMLFIIIISMALGNFYEEFFEDQEYATLTSNFPLPHFILSNMLQISLGVLITGVLIAFGKSRFE